MSRQDILCCDEKLKSNTERILLQISLCCDIMKNRRQNLCCDIIFSYRDTDYCNLENPVEIERIRRKKTSLPTRQSMSQHCMKNFCRDKVMNVVTLKDKIFGLDRESKLRQVMLA